MELCVVIDTVTPNMLIFCEKTTRYVPVLEPTAEDIASAGSMYFFLQEWVELISRAQDAVGTESGNSASADCVFPFYYHDNISGRQVTAYTCSESGRDDITCWYVFVKTGL